MSQKYRDAAIRVLMMPRDTNYHGTIFGGVILSHIDQAGAVAAIRAGCKQVATVAMDKVEFHQPVKVGEEASMATPPPELVARLPNTVTSAQSAAEDWPR